jgi:hypothetical protein
MNLHGSINKLQTAIVELYQELQTRFLDNKMISELWNAMAHDVSQQIKSLDALPSSFWNHLKNESDAINVDGCFHNQRFEKNSDRSLRGCFDLSLQMEEPVILKAYIPIIRNLRKNPENQSLDFYIMVKAHLARISRVTQAFSGDPVIIQRSNLLLQNFERDVQETQEIPAHARQEKSKTQAAISQHKSQPIKKAAKSPARPLPSSKSPLSRPARAKPLVEKVELSRRRARR